MIINTCSTYLLKKKKDENLKNNKHHITIRPISGPLGEKSALKISELPILWGVKGWLLFSLQFWLLFLLRCILSIFFFFLFLQPTMIRKNQKLIRVETCNEWSQLSNIRAKYHIWKPLAPVFYDSKHSAVNKCCKIIEICKYASLGFFSECFTELFHSIFGQLFWAFVFSFSSHQGVLYYTIFRARTLVVLRHGVLAN